MSNMDVTNRSNFFPNSDGAKTARTDKTTLKRNDFARRQQLDKMSKADAKVKIPDAVRDFSRIKKAVDAAPELDNSAKIASLKSQINNGTYKMNYEAIADKLLETEF
jgi:negative regulator of flagellin synthesis FlgM